MSEVTWYIGGTVRSGSTLFSGLLANATGGTNVGELHILWRSFSLRRICTCGQPVEDCQMWGKVADRVLSCLKLGSVSEAAAIEAREPSQRRVLRYGPDLKIAPEVVALRGETEKAVREVTGNDVVVDSSKVAGTLCVALQGHAQVRAVHLVRDPRAVAYSMSHPKPDPSLDGRMLPTAGPMRSTVAWLTTHLAHERLAATGAFVAGRIRYEDFASSPGPTIGRLAGVDATPDQATLSSRGEHAIAGNPWRFEHSRAVEPDRRWQEDMGALTRWSVNAISLPRLLRYGYSLDTRS